MTTDLSHARDSAHPVVSVLMLTYNHERFIQQAIDSVLMQSISGQIELLIGDDASTDRTRLICETAQQQYPKTIRLLTSDRNLGFQRNFSRLWKAARGQYIALLEGDDYWTHSQKLSRQVALLECHPEWSGCFHRTLLIEESGRAAPMEFSLRSLPSEIHLEQIVAENCIYTSSVIYRRGIVVDLPAWFADLPIGDWPLHILHAVHGPLGFIDDVMSVYRLHAGGIWSTQRPSTRWQGTFKMYDALEDHAAEPLRSLALTARRRWLETLLRDHLAYLEKVEHRYLTLQLDHIAAFFKGSREILNAWFKRRT